MAAPMMVEKIGIEHVASSSFDLIPGNKRGIEYRSSSFPIQEDKKKLKYSLVFQSGNGVYYTDDGDQYESSWTGEEWLPLTEMHIFLDSIGRAGLKESIQCVDDFEILGEDVINKFEMKGWSLRPRGYGKSCRTLYEHLTLDDEKYSAFGSAVSTAAGDRIYDQFFSALKGVIKKGMTLSEARSVACPVVDHNQHFAETITSDVVFAAALDIIDGFEMEEPRQQRIRLLLKLWIELEQNKMPFMKLIEDTDVERFLKGFYGCNDYLVRRMIFEAFHEKNLENCCVLRLLFNDFRSYLNEYHKDGDDLEALVGAFWDDPNYTLSDMRNVKYAHYAEEKLRVASRLGILPTNGDEL